MNALSVLLVEDDALIGLLLAEMLAGMGHDVCAVATTTAEAVAASAQHQPDLMIVDARLGAESGIDAVERILRTRRVPHMFISGARIQPPWPGTVMLQKPFSEPELVHAIARTLAASEA
jgi:two-component system, response regulator PdtaR